jgi:beta-galactosidase
MTLICRKHGLFRNVFLLVIFFGLISGNESFAVEDNDAGTSPRQMLPLSGSGWQFFGGGRDDMLPTINSDAYHSAKWINISVPHTFQVRGDMSLEQGWYRTRVLISDIAAHRHLYLVFEGAASIADVYVNGQHLGQHRGAYTRFIFDATQALHAGPDNDLAVKLDNRATSINDCLPNTNRLYTVWGGLYRQVWLLTTKDLQIDPTYYASPGVFVTPTHITDESSQLDIKVLLRNTSSAPKSAEVKATILDPNNQPAQTLTGQASVVSNQGTSLTLSGTVLHPQLWSPGSPNLYHVQVDVSEGGQVTDSVTQPLGFRSMVWDFKQGLLQLNRQPITLYGANIHQETEKKGAAMTPEDFIANFDAMQDLGINFIRLPHYPHAQIEYDLCDRRGILCWAENGHTNNEPISATADQIVTEMVVQNYNHPSIAMWSVGNEAKSANTAEHQVPLVKALDPTRPVMVANMNCANADYRAQNSYPGWYETDRWSFRPQGLISEIGAGGVVTTHCDYNRATHKVNSYEPEEYQQLVSETIFEMAFRRSEGKLGMLDWWAFREFNDFKYKNSEAPFKHGINSKGLETFAGDKKDVYYLYRSFLRPNTPTLWITSKRYFLRRGAVDNGIKVYSNAKSVTLKLNGETVSTLSNGQYSQNDPVNRTGNGEIDNVFFWPAPLHEGKNTVVVTDDKGTTDAAKIYFQGANGLPEVPTSNPLITNLVSSNANNSVYYMDMPLKAQWPFYYDLDSTADNSLDLIPDALQGATWLALSRVTKPGKATDVSFTLTKPATIYVMTTKQNKEPGFVPANFKEVDVGPLSWRGDDLILVPAQLYSRHVAARESVKLSLGDRDALVLMKTD